MALSVLAAVRRARYAVLLFWAVLTVLGALNARRFTENTSIDLEVPPASRSYEGTQLFERAFPATCVKVGALVTRADGGPVLGDDLRALTADLGAWSAEVGIRLPSAVVGYYTLVDAKLDELASPFVSDPQDPSNSTASILVVSLPLNNSDALAVALSARARSNGTSPLDVKLTGQPYFLQAALDGVAHDVSSVHPKVVPFALIPFLWIVRSWRLSLVTLACICATAASSYFAMYLVSAHTQVANFAPSMMLSATIATSIDYSLFLLSRLREELAEGAATVSELEGALEVALHHAGHTVLVSVRAGPSAGRQRTPQAAELPFQGADLAASRPPSTPTRAARWRSASSGSCSSRSRSSPLSDSPPVRATLSAPLLRIPA